MSELKVYVPQDGPYGLVPEEGGAPVEEETCYLKSEADKLIAEKDAKIKKLEKCKQWMKVCEEIAAVKERRQKYKRCLSIISNIKAAQGRAFFVSDEYLEWLTKWLERWLKIAEKFHEVMPIEVKTYKEAASGNSKRED